MDSRNQARRRSHLSNDRRASYLPFRWPATAMNELGPAVFGELSSRRLAVIPGKAEPAAAL
jgi:hypothetical protein